MGFTFGDLMAQLATKPSGERFNCDLLRTARLAVYGGLIGGPVGHFWYNYLDQVRVQTASYLVYAIRCIPCWNHGLRDVAPLLPQDC